MAALQSDHYTEVSLYLNNHHMWESKEGSNQQWPENVHVHVYVAFGSGEITHNNQ